ncbi:MAG: U32 family peptidase [Defluviitaleaceae bacterium]|nr:U32 family peptidase [Defluviitaleaceae bacterium]
MKRTDKVELLAPAGDLERLKYAVEYGADAVYIGGTSFGLRAKAKNFDIEQMAQGVQYAHARGVKVFVTANVFARNDDFDAMTDYFKQVQDIGVDALIIADLGVFHVARQAVPQMEIHISTQANITNYQTALFWAKQGAQRVVLARELGFGEIAEIHKKAGDKVAIEAFVHGSMCISYSGRCLLSAFFNHKDANKGECTNVCRYNFALVEERRQGEFFPIYQEDNGSFILNSRDLCMIEHIPRLISSGIYSFKIEGRMKTPYYVATVVKTYREAIDDYFTDPKLYESKKTYYMGELLKSSNRDFTTGFFLGNPGSLGQVYGGEGYSRTYDFLGVVRHYDEKTQIAIIEQRNKFLLGDTVEFLRAGGEQNFAQKIEHFTDDEGNSIESAPHAQQIVKIKTIQPVGTMDIMRGLAE